jgi:hypothetical protein
MALDILLIPSMSADPERLFSGAKITVLDRRNRLGIYTLGALECLKSWLGIKSFDYNKEEDRLDQGECDGAKSHACHVIAILTRIGNSADIGLCV